ncbi:MULTISPECIES: hypothetical protein [Paenibacillus]|uniref:Uncharacterized protein n=1 Tax=Paenibacillus albilobatus TaxID=2716884 RepID=A0A919XJH3_9BACL|nr:MULTISPECIES: hypothetical protein [Paenibacillus]GIO32879.1 hypothetical protein J2TS6_40200 [Paenibacillus albilobatus]
MPPTKPANSAVPEETTDPDAPAPLLPIGNLETDENGNVVNDPSQANADDSPSTSGITADGFEGLEMYVLSSQWSSKDKQTTVTIEVNNGSDKTVEAGSSNIAAITVDQAIVDSGIDPYTSRRKILPGGKAKIELGFSVKPEEIAGYALMEDSLSDKPLRAIITNPNVGGN